ncbi:hypothetical protein HYC85_025805 [Camellia sinensis]|uniref:Exonuclease domain-containing protein n=1 Tax=Camellia sinensis TaxID=4442 RepID=A0A7J7GC06_CAMSI|nr:hypothetical protein HYC85_025805 [Camellia sinensis]
MPAGVAKEIDRIQANFLGGRSDLRRKVHMVSWEVITRSKNLDGLGGETQEWSLEFRRPLLAWEEEEVGRSSSVLGMGVDSAAVICAGLLYSVLAIELNSDEGAAVVLLQPSCCSCAGLNTEAVLGYEVRKEGAPHNCLDDTTAAMKLVLAKIESGFDNAIPLVREGVPEIKKSKLLLHRIPVNVPDEELHKIIPGDFTIEIRNQEEANQAFENIDGYREKDSYGLPQKCVSFQYDSGSIDSFCVRKMTSEDFLGQVSSRKRSFQVEETTTGESKKLKSCQEAGEQTKAGSNLCDGHLKEIERLKQELRQG